VILCHGRGKHPQWLVVEPLRKGIHNRLGYHTLSLQMPNDDKSWKEYADDFPEAYRRIQAGIDFLRNEKGIKIIYLMGHSMGSRMASAFLAEHPDAEIAGFIGVGMRNNGGRPLDASVSLEGVSIPVLDLYGDGGDGTDQEHAWERETLVSDSYRQVVIPDANHRFTEHEDALVQAVVDWLSSLAI
jgi:pimeloyl-ACP methyl ester carboxylesterase